MDNFAFVAGSAHIDILARATGEEGVVDKIGDVRFEVGGCAGNVATNLAALNVQVRVVTAMNSSPYSQIVVQYLKSHGVDVQCAYDRSLPTAAFSAHISRDGEMTSAVTSTPVDRFQFDKGFLYEAMFGARFAVLDCNLSEGALRRMVELCRSMAIPVFIAGVSEAKSLKVLSLGVPFQGLFLNRREAQFLKGQVPDCNRYEDLARVVGAPLIITRDAEGVLIVDEHSVDRVGPQHVTRSTGNSLGSGDVFLSATLVYRVIHSLSWRDAASQAIDFVKEVNSRSNCNLGSTEGVDAILASINRGATIDGLTGLVNRRAAQDALSENVSKAGRSGCPMSVVLLDVDHFKSINDTFGHPVGDEVLKMVGGVLRESIREANGDVVGRWGGEEFICILPGTRLAAAQAIAERMRLAVRDRIQSPRPITISAGVTTLSDTDTFVTLLERVDAALYRAKNSGRDRVQAAKAVRQARGCTVAARG